MKYGYDFRQYSEASLNRRLTSILGDKRSLLGVLDEILSDSTKFQKLLPRLTVNTTEPFRDPRFYRSIREHVVPVLKTYPLLNVWSAGCSTGEELYSLLILFKEEGLFDRTTFFATDISPEALSKAKLGIYSHEVVQQFTRNYTEAGGTRAPSEYYTAEYGSVCFDSRLRENVVFSDHNLVVDDVFTEMNLILCRNVLIYFNRNLQNKVLELFDRSLAAKGFLGLGSRESIRFSSIYNKFEDVDKAQRIYRKLGSSQ
ncbi:MAG: CheR family methyltransferase [Bdellovibrionota bacterium]